MTVQLRVRITLIYVIQFKIKIKFRFPNNNIGPNKKINFIVLSMVKLQNLYWWMYSLLVKTVGLVSFLLTASYM